MAKIPKPRREGQSGGMNHRSSNSGFRRSGGNVKPPGGGWFNCGVVALAGLGLVGATLATGSVALYHWFV